MRYKNLIIGIMLVLIIGIFAGCTSESDDNQNSTNGNGGSEDNGQVLSVGKIAFKSGYPSGDYVHIIDTDGDNEKKLSDGYEPMVWSPDGEKIAFILNKNSLIVIDKDGTNKKIISIPSYPKTIDWSNNGKNILLSYGKIYDVENEIEILDIGYNNVRGAIYAPTSDKIVYLIKNETYDYSLFIIDSDGANNNRLIDDVIDINHNYYVELTWSPDGEKITFADDWDLYVINSDGTNKIKLGEGSRPAWSPDSKKIVYWSTSGPLYIVNPDGTGQKTIASGGGDFIGGPSWSSDGKKLTYSYGENVYIVDADGSNNNQLCIGMDPVWSSN